MWQYVFLDCLSMGGTTLHAGMVAPMVWNSASVTFLKKCYYGCQWDLIWCNDTYNVLAVCNPVILMTLQQDVIACDWSSGSLYIHSISHNRPWLCLKTPFNSVLYRYLFFIVNMTLFRFIHFCNKSCEMCFSFFMFKKNFKNYNTGYWLAKNSFSFQG